MKMNISDKAKKALIIIKDNEPIMPSRFAQLMWPDNPAHNKVSNIGRSGATRGVGMWFAAGGFMAKMKRMGLIIEVIVFSSKDNKYIYRGYRITNLGKEQIE